MSRDPLNFHDVNLIDKRGTKRIEVQQMCSLAIRNFTSMINYSTLDLRNFSKRDLDSGNQLESMHFRTLISNHLTWHINYRVELLPWRDVDKKHFN